MCIPSELIESKITRVIGILVYECVNKYGGTKEAWLDVAKQLRALDMFVSMCRATHCILALSNELGLLRQIAEDDELRDFINNKMRNCDH